MSNINPIFSIEYPNLDTLLYIRKQYPQLADMEISTTIVDEECILTHYLPSEDETCEVAAELIYFGTLLASTNHFHRTYDEHELLYRCVNLRHEAKPEQSTDEERVNQVSVEHARRNDVLTITYPRDQTVFSNVNFKAPNLTLVPQAEVINSILFMLKDKFGSQPELRLYVGEWNVTVHIFDFTSFCIGANATIEDVVPNINALVLGRKYQGEPWVEVKRTDELLFVNQDDLKSTTLGDLLRRHLANSQQEEEQQAETPFTESEPDVAKSEQSDEKIKVKIELPKFERVDQIEVKCDRNDVLTITYPRDETIFSDVDFEARSTYFDLQTVVSNDILDVLKEAFGVKPETRLFVGRNNVSFHIFDFTRFCLGGKTTMEAVVSKINDVLLKPENRGKVEAKKVKAPEELLFVNLDNPEPVTLSKILANAVKHGKLTLGLKVFKGFKPNEVVPLQGGEHSTCTSKQFDAGVAGYIVKEVKPEKFESLLGHVEAAYDAELDQLSIAYPLDKTLFSVINLNDPEEYLGNITSISDSVRTIFKLEYDFEASVRMLGIKDKIKIYVDDLSKVAEHASKMSEKMDMVAEDIMQSASRAPVYHSKKPKKVEVGIKDVIMNVVPKVNALVLKPQY